MKKTSIVTSNNIDVFYENQWEDATLRKMGDDGQVFAAMKRDGVYRIFPLWRRKPDEHCVHKR